MKTLRTRLGLLLSTLLVPAAIQAHPYASGITNAGANLNFYLNESGGTVTVIWDSGASSNVLGVLAKGLQTTPLAGHTNFAVSVSKTSTGSPSQITTDSDFYAIWNSPRGVDINKNPKIGNSFGRTYVGNSGTANGGKGIGLFALNADLTISSVGTPGGIATNGWAAGLFAGSGGSGPNRFRIAPDGGLLVDDFSTINAGLWEFAPDLQSSNLVLGIIGQTAATAAQVHGDLFGTPLITGSLAAGNMVLWTADSGMGAPDTSVKGPNTFPGSFNCLFRYDIGAGPLPWTHKPDYAYTVGLDSIGELRVELDLAADGSIFGGFGRANLSNGNIQELEPTGTNIIYNSLHDGADLFNGVKGSTSAVGTYCGIRISPDGHYIASVDINNGITLATMTNNADGHPIPDEGSIFGIVNASATANSRGMCWDAADNIYVNSSGQGLLRGYSLGLPTTCVTYNDLTGTNGTFQIVLPPLSASIATLSTNASQNYINSGGTPIAAGIAVTLTTNTLSAPLTIGFSMAGTSLYSTNYLITVGNVGNGVIVATNTAANNTITFPAGTMPGGGNWTANITVTPTALPLTGPTLTAVVRLNTGTNYVAAAPSSGTVSIFNTGPQLLLITQTNYLTTVVINGTTMNRGISGDYAQFLILRYGDLNGPGNSAGSVTPRSYSITNFTFTGNASNPADFTAAPQNKDLRVGRETPTNMLTGVIYINPGDVAITNVIGNPVKHTNVFQPATNITFTLALKNGTTTNFNSVENYPFWVNTSNVTFTLIDNTVVPENVVLWSSALTNVAESTNWTLTYAATNMATNFILPFVKTNYDATNATDNMNVFVGGTNDYEVTFGQPIASLPDGSVVPQSDIMAAKGWTTALRMTVNKNGNYPAPSAVNLYPQGTFFRGNYAFRFQMYLSINSFATNNTAPGSFPTEFAMFGINHKGTNCVWKPTTPVSVNTGGSGPTNADGLFTMINANAGNITPADFDGFQGQALPNSGSLEPVSNTSASQSGIFKHPPFSATKTAVSAAGGQPINKWVDVSVEMQRQTNVNVYINNQAVLASYNITNYYTNGTVMLGYEDPISNVSDESSYVLYSNVRVVEIAPAITVQPTNGNAMFQVGTVTNVTFTSSADYAYIDATNSLTNQWWKGTSNAPTPTLTNLLATTISNVPAFTTSWTVTNAGIADAVSYYAAWRDYAGSVTSVLGGIEVIVPPTNTATFIGNTTRISIGAFGPLNPTYQWQHAGTNLANTTGHWGGVTTTTLIITNTLAGDVGSYAVIVAATSTANGLYGGTLTTSNGILSLASATVAPSALTVNWGAPAVFSVTSPGFTPTSYQWRKEAVNLSNVGNVSGATNAALTINPSTTNDAGNYSVIVTNTTGTLTSSTGTLTVIVPPPSFVTGTPVKLLGGNAILTFGSTNIYDTTNAWTLQTSTNVEGPYANTAGTFATSGTNFQVTVPAAGTNMFFRLLHN